MTARLTEDEIAEIERRERTEFPSIDHSHTPVMSAFNDRGRLLAHIRSTPSAGDSVEGLAQELMLIDTGECCWEEALPHIKNRYRAMAHTALTARAAPEWRDIASAPHMKTIPLYAVSDVGPNGEVRNWKMATGCWHSGYADDDQWSSWEWDGRQLRPYDLQPTHWQPLPKPPAAPTEREG